MYSLSLSVKAVALLGLTLSATSALAQTPPTAEAQIVGGTSTKDGKNTYQVGIMTASVADNFHAQFCGGTLVSSHWVITAAHCVSGKSAGDIQVLTGTSKLDGSGTRRPVSAIMVHPGFQYVTDPDSGLGYVEDDVAVLKLGTDAEPTLQYAKLINGGQEQKFAEPGTKLLVTGWGNTNPAQPYYPSNLLKVKVPVASSYDCNAPTAYNGIVSEAMLCAGAAAGGQDSCQGDSGGPLVVSRKVRGKQVFLLAGIVSWGQGCAQPGKYGVYTRVSTYRQWIMDQINAGA